MGPTLAPIVDRLWGNIRFTDECWEWKRYCHSSGHGKVSFHGSPSFVHRVAWELSSGPVPEGLCVLHRCNNPPCVRLDHLYLGTRADNNRDAGRDGLVRNQWSRADNCFRGHPLDGRKPNGTRRCLTCHRNAEAIRRKRAYEVRA